MGGSPPLGGGGGLGPPDRRRHMAEFIKAERQIYSDRFTPEEQGKAWQILD